jgi:hypothetical protein
VAFIINPDRIGIANMFAAARYFVYELYDATSGHVGAWKALRDSGKVQATVARAVERGWAIVRDEGKGRTKVRSASLRDGRYLIHSIKPVGRYPARIIEIENVDSRERFHGSGGELERMAFSLLRPGVRLSCKRPTHKRANKR